MILGLVFILILLLSAASPLATEGQAYLTTEQYSAKDRVLAADNSPQDSHYIPVLAINGAIGLTFNNFITHTSLSINSQANTPALFITREPPGRLNNIFSIFAAHTTGEKDE